MDEADRVAHRVGVIDHGKLVAAGNARRSSRSRPETESLEEAFLELTGSTHSRRERRLGRPDAAVCKDVERRQAMSAIYILWLREMKRYIRSRVQIVASPRPAAAVSAGARIRTRAGVSARGQRQLSPVCSARRDRHDGAVLVDLFRARPALGPPVRIPERNAGRASTAAADHDWAHAWRAPLWLWCKGCW